jgi:hypothetical protein
VSEGMSVLQSRMTQTIYNNVQPGFYCNHVPESVITVMSSRLSVVEISEQTAHTISQMGNANRLTIKTNSRDAPFLKFRGFSP